MLQVYRLIPFWRLFGKESKLLGRYEVFSSSNAQSSSSPLRENIIRNYCSYQNENYKPALNQPILCRHTKIFICAHLGLERMSTCQVPNQKIRWKSLQRSSWCSFELSFQYDKLGEISALFDLFESFIKDLKCSDYKKISKKSYSSISMSKIIHVFFARINWWTLYRLLSLSKLSSYAVVEMSLSIQWNKDISLISFVKTTINI